MLGTKIYQVNRSDRSSDVNNHRFIEYTIIGVFIVRDGYIYVISEWDSIDINTNFLSHNCKSLGDVAHLGNKYKRLYTNVYAKDTEDFLRLLNENLHNNGDFYFEKDLAKEEIKKLREGEIKESERRIKNLKEYIEKLKKYERN